MDPFHHRADIPLPYNLRSGNNPRSTSPRPRANPYTHEFPADPPRPHRLSSFPHPRRTNILLPGSCPIPVPARRILWAMPCAVHALVYIHCRY